MDISLAILSGLYILILVLIYSIERISTSKDVFSAGRIFVYFKTVYAFTLVWFAFNQISLESLVFSQVDPEFRQLSLVRLAYCFSIFSLVITYLGVLVGSKSKMRSLRVFLNTFFGKKYFGVQSNQKSRTLIFGSFLFGFGILVYIYFVFKMGGLSTIWDNLSARVEMMAGLGYYYKIYSFFIFLGSTLIFSFAGARRKWVIAAIPVCITIFVLASLGQRGPVIAYLFSLFIVYHYTIKRVTNLLTMKNVMLGFCILVFIVGAVQFRDQNAVSTYADNPAQLVGDSVETFEHHVIQRFGRVERDIVILKYFSENRFWLGASYYSLLVAPVPRTVYLDKPPIDTGRYLLAMAKGEKIFPPVPTSELPSSSWPDGNWAGYMNFSIPGFIGLFFLSGFIFGLVFSYMKSTNYSVISVIVYSYFSWSGDVNLSPMGVVDILMFIVPLIAVVSMYRFSVFLSRRPLATR